MDPLAAYLPGASSSAYIPSLNHITSQVTLRTKRTLRRYSSLTRLEEVASSASTNLSSFTPDLGASSSKFPSLSIPSLNLFPAPKKEPIVQDERSEFTSFLYRSPSLNKSESSWKKTNVSLRERLTARTTPSLARSNSSLSRRSDASSLSGNSTHSCLSAPSAKLKSSDHALPALHPLRHGPDSDPEVPEAALKDSPTLPDSPISLQNDMALSSVPIGTFGVLGLERTLLETLGLVEEDASAVTEHADTSHSTETSEPQTTPVVATERPGETKSGPMTLDGVESLIQTRCPPCSCQSSQRLASPTSASNDQQLALRALPQLTVPPSLPIPATPTTGTHCTRPLGTRGLKLPERPTLPALPLPSMPLPPRPARSILRLATTNLPTTSISSRRYSALSTVSRGSTTSRGSLETAGPLTPDMDDAALPTVFEVQQQWPWGESAIKARDGNEVIPE